MKQLHFSYDMKICFDAPVREHHFTIKCTPLSDARQRIENLNVSILPNSFLSEDMDSYGNHCIYGYEKGEHTLFSIHAEGDAVTGLAPALVPMDAGKAAIFKYQTGITVPGEKLLAFHGRFRMNYRMCALDRALFFSQRIYETMQYAPGATDINTTAEEALGLQKGVCQDYAHILLSLCRIEKIPARYVVGFLKGEGASHAWVEVLTEDGIYGLDPTNNLMVKDEHIKVSCGRDYNDCTINYGVFTGNAAQKRDIHVLVEEGNALRSTEV